MIKIQIRDLSTGEIQSRWGVSRATAWRARRRGWLWLGYHRPGGGGDHPSQRPRTARPGSVAQIAARQGLHRSTVQRHLAGTAQPRTARRESTWSRPDVDPAEVLLSARHGATAAVRRMGASRTYLVDAVGEALVCLCSQSHHPGIASAAWRFVVARNAAMNFILRERTWLRYAPYRRNRNEGLPDDTETISHTL